MLSKSILKQEAQHDNSVRPYKLYISVLLPLDFHLKSLCIEGHVSPPNARTFRTDSLQRRIFFKTSSPKL